MWRVETFLKPSFNSLILKWIAYRHPDIKHGGGRSENAHITRFWKKWYGKLKKALRDNRHCSADKEYLWHRPNITQFLCLRKMGKRKSGFQHGTSSVSNPNQMMLWNRNTGITDRYSRGNKCSNRHRGRMEQKKRERHIEKTGDGGREWREQYRGMGEGDVMWLQGSQSTR